MLRDGTVGRTGCYRMLERYEGTVLVGRNRIVEQSRMDCFEANTRTVHFYEFDWSILAINNQFVINL
jgi:hypothetical protein